ncbi:hypothetical protein [Nonomuraea guangzhouensis]|uniref:FtsX extracellular domain-containing protein n=1 Tax=Nonomuraea guangzhouensis TaxID=1291555 RepID=A0ABW4GLP3_9ACTN|nr:hypothetical protein [Nonomuraea guangzhouensis]
MDALKTMWETVPPATPDDLAGARRRLLAGMHTRRRVVTAPRLLVAAGVAAAAATAPLIIATGPPAYAVTKGPDGTITVTVNELRDPQGLQKELGEAGIKADVTFLAQRMRCASPRFASVDGAYDGPPAAGSEDLKARTKGWRSVKAAQVISVREIGIHPEYIKTDETLVLEFRDNHNATRPWQLGAWLAQAGTPVKPCTPVEGDN